MRAMKKIVGEKEKVVDGGHGSRGGGGCGTGRIWGVWEKIKKKRRNK